jgi:hypothetical protein
VQGDKRYQRPGRNGENVPGGRIHLMVSAELAGKAVNLSRQHFRSAVAREVGPRIVATR